MSSKNIVLAYADQNEPLAQQIQNELELGGITVAHAKGAKSGDAPLLSEQLTEKPGPILLLITDNFLHSANCMEGMLSFLQERREDIMPIIAEGTRRNELGEDIAVPTHFERISDIIQYINHWQDLYLDLRRQKREQTGKSEEALQEQLRVVREISSEISEYLRQLRSLNYALFENLENEDYLQVFRFLNIMPNWETFRAKRKSAGATRATAVQPVGHEPEEAEEPEEESSEVFIAEEPTVEDVHEPLPHPEEAEEEMETPVDPEDEIADEPVIGAEAETEDAGSPDEGEIPGSHQMNEPLPEQEEIPEPPAYEEETIPEPIAMNGAGYHPPQSEITPESILEKALHADPEDAIDILEQGLEQYPDNAAMLYRRAVLLVKSREDHENAMNVLNNLLALHPTHVEGLFLRGELAETAGDHNQALEDYRKVASMNPQFPDIFYRLGLVKGHFMGDISGALKDFQEAVKRNRGNVDAYYQIGLILNEAMSDPNQAESYFRKTVSLDPDHEFAHYDLALIYHKRGDRAAAFESYVEAARVNPEMKTPENDLAFSFDPNKASGLQHDTISALKENLARLEELIRVREEEEARNQPTLKGEGKVALITGATSGIGYATARAFAGEGYRLILTGRREDRLEELKSALESELSAQVLTLAFDVRDQKAVEDAIRQLPAEWTGIDILVNNAGKAKGLDPIQEGHLDHWEEMIDTNLKGLLYVTRAVAPGMIARREGMVINIGSSAGKEVYPKGNVYCATKSAVNALTEGMRLDLHAHNIRVGMVNPGHVEDTEFALVRFDGDAERAKIYEDFQPLKAEDVAEAILFMATRPPHVNIQDIYMLGTQQASNLVINRSGR